MSYSEILVHLVGASLISFAIFGLVYKALQRKFNDAGIQSFFGALSLKSIGVVFQGSDSLLKFGVGGSLLCVLLILVFPLVSHVSGGTRLTPIDG